MSESLKNAKSLVYRAILLNRRFTVAQMCSWTDLGREQVYPHLAKLANEGLLEKETAELGANRPAHRPYTLYCVPEDVDKRALLAQKIAPFLRAGEESDNPILRKLRVIRGALDMVEARLVSMRELFLSPRDLSDVESDLRDLELLRTQIETAPAEIKLLVDDSAALEDELAHSYARAEADRVERISSEVSDIRVRVNNRLEQLAAELHFTAILKEMYGIFKKRVADLAPELHRLLADRFSNAKEFTLRGIISLVDAELRRARSCGRDERAEIAWILASAAGRYTRDVQLCIGLAEEARQLGGRDKNVIDYNLANLHLLNGKGDQALALWQQTVNSFTRREDRAEETVSTLAIAERLSAFRHTLIYVGDPGRLRSRDLADLDEQLGIEGTISVASMKIVDSFGVPPFIVKPTLFEWAEPKSSPWGALIANSASVKHHNLFAYGPLAESAQFPGIPTLRIATAIATFGVPAVEAWKCANYIKQGTSLLILHKTSIFDDSAIQRLSARIPGFALLPVASAASKAAAAAVAVAQTAAAG